jgi:protein O-mannosyl-transferase
VRKKSARQKKTVAGSPERAPDQQFGSLAARPAILLCIALGCVTFALYRPVIAHPFINYDDDTYVTANAHVKSGPNQTSLAWALTSTEQSNWHPLTWISHELDCQIYGLHPAGHHFTNLMLHGINVLLLFLILMFVTQAMGRSFLVALLFAIHPLNVESVAWVAERKNILSTVFFLLAIGAYCFYAKKPGRKRYLLVLLLFVFGLASKPMVITLPCVLLLLDYWPLQRVLGIKTQSVSFPVPQRPWPRLLLEKVPLFLLSAASAVVTVFAQRSGGAINSLTHIPFGARAENAICAYLEYFLKVLWPSSLAVYYPHPGNTIAFWKILSAAVFLIAVSALVWRTRLSRPYLLVGWCWFLGILVPVIGLIQVGNQAIADRYMYVPTVGLLVMLVWGTADFLNAKVDLRIRVALAGTLVVALLFATHRQIGFWKSSSDLWSHALTVTKDNYVAEDNLGEALAGDGRNDDALVHFYDAERISPDDIASRVNIAGILQSRGEVRQAVSEYSTAIKIAAANPNVAANAGPLSTALANVGTLYSVNGNYEKARENYRRALEINPAALDDLIAKFYKFAAVQPEGKKYLWLGEMLEQSGRSVEAKNAYEQALQAEPTLTEAEAGLERMKQRGAVPGK